MLTIEPERSLVDESSEEEPDLTGVRVIVVDDDLDTQELLTAALTQYGAEVLTLAAAAEVLDSLESFQPHVLVSDIGMADMDGYELIRQIRALRRDRQLPALALTAFARQEDQAAAIAAGFQQYMAKPVEPLQLIIILAQLLTVQPPAPN